ncbi:1-acyl-sn-glycerol-3-phosphate acyltransferase [Zoogloea sp.]|uniref:lysophospholipid acyltransferase family protein n=1 Tax=Zoogloea sp. TaxID=49181 RepID=UPI0025F9ACB9|nr:lysophospholipid acyltransferase family protein [Zoogloea sp.]MCK6394702.1 1-acyl-sn-glycerol-3-phosphate acyltransferase [Zoogloea sp.]
MFVDRLLASALCGFARALTGVRALWLGSEPDARPRVYFANHRSHGDFVLIWASLPPPLRRRTRPVAGADYWLTTSLRRFLINRVFRGVCIDRRPGRNGPNPVEQMGEALGAGESLILFPEGTRNMGDGLLPFKSGLHHLAKAHPEAELIPVWIENLGRVMPKGSLIPVPLLCTLSFGPPLSPVDGESREAFLTRARTALLDLAPPAD